MELPEVTEVKRLELRPGDRLIVKLDHWPSGGESAEIYEHLEQVFGEKVPALIVGPGADIEVISPEPGGM